MSFSASPMAAPVDKPPYLLHIRSSTSFVTWTVALATFTDIFLYGVVVPVVPFALETRANVSPSKVQYWISVLLAVYGAALLAGSIPAGYAADRCRSRQIPFLVGLLLLAGATALLAIGTSIPLIIIGRIIQGLSGSIVWTAGLALLVDAVGPGALGQQLGFVAASLSLALFLAPLLGGIVFKRAGYEAVFGMCWALIGLDAVLRILMVEPRNAAKWKNTSEEAAPEQESSNGPNDQSDDVEKGNNVVVLPRERGETAKEDTDLQSSNEKTTNPPSHAPRSQKETGEGSKTDIDADDSGHLPRPQGVSIDARVDTATSHAAAAAETEATNPRHSAFRILVTYPRLLVCLVCTVAQAVLLTSLDASLPQHARLTYHYNSLTAGLLFIPLTIPALLSPLVGRGADKWGTRWLTVAGFTVAAPCFIALRVTDQNTTGTQVGLFALLTGIGIGATLAFGPLTAEIGYAVAAVEAKRPGVFGKKGAYAMAYGFYNGAFALGCVIGPLWGGLVAENAGFGNMGASLGGFAIAAAIIAMLWVGGWVGAGRNWRTLWKERTRSRRWFGWPKARGNAHDQ